MTGNSGRAASVHVLRVTLRDVRPAVWRRLEVPSAITLGQLHQVLQAAFDWSGDHLHELEVRGIRYMPDREDLYGPVLSGGADRDEDVTVLGRVAPRPGDVVDYTYDFGDDWRHRLEVESVGPARPGQQYPGCTDGAGLAPQKDTGRVQPGRFGEQTRDRLNAHLRLIGAVDGRDLPVEEVPADPHFTGLFPDLNEDDAGECLCGCGETSGGSGQPVLPMLHPVPEEELARLAAGSPMVRRAVALATWVGPGRALTPSHLLRPADAVRAVEELGLAECLLPRSGVGEAASATGFWASGVAAVREDTPGGVVAALADGGASVGGGVGAEPGGGRRSAAGEPGRRPAQQVLQLFGEADQEPAAGRVREPGGRRVRSAKELPSLHPLWAGCLAAGLIEMRGGKAHAGPGLAVWRTQADPAAQVESWCALLGGYLRARDDTARAGRDHLSQIRGQMLQLGIPLLYAMAHEPLPVGALALAFADLDEFAPGFGPSLLLELPVVFCELGRTMEDWLVAGVVEQTAVPQEEADELAAGVAELQAGVEEELTPESGNPATGTDQVTKLKAALSEVVEVLLDGPAVRLTPLGRYGLARLLTAHGWQVPCVGACLDAEPEELLDHLAGYLAPDAAEGATRWVAAQGEGWTPGLERVMRSAAVKDDDGPARRGLLPTVLAAAGPRVVPLLDAAAADPWLAPALALTCYQLGLGPEPSVGQWLWLVVDGLSATLDDPGDFAEKLQDSPLEELLARPSALAHAVGLDHPHAREVLQAAAPQLDDPDLARALRKALAGRSGNPALRPGGRRPGGGRAGRRRGDR